MHIAMFYDGYIQIVSMISVGEDTDRGQAVFCFTNYFSGKGKYKIVKNASLPNL